MVKGEPNDIAISTTLGTGDHERGAQQQGTGIYHPVQFHVRYS